MVETPTKPAVYIETTVISYLTAWPSRDVIRAGEQQTTREWWNTQRVRFELFTSQVVIVECAAGDPVAATDRLKILEGLPLVAVTGGDAIGGRVGAPARVSAPCDTRRAARGRVRGKRHRLPADVEFSSPRQRLTRR